MRKLLLTKLIGLASLVALGSAFVIPNRSFAIRTTTSPLASRPQTRRRTDCAERIQRKQKPSTSSLYASSAVSIGNEDEDSSDTPINWWKPMMAICVPAWIGMMADPLLSLMDTAFVGRIGSVELAALGACTSIFHLAFNAFRATTAATTTLVASAETVEEQKKVISLSLGLGVALGWGVLLILQQTGPWCLARMGVSGTSMLYPPAFEYLSTRAWAAPAVLGLVVSEGAFRGFGDTKIPLVASLVASFINLVLDPLLIFTFGFGVAGAAAATAISQFGALGVYIYFLLKRNMLPNRNDPTKIKTRHVIMTILEANLAMMTKQASLLLAWAYATAKATRLGKEHVAAHQVGLSFWLVFALWLDGSAVAAQVLTAQAVAGPVQTAKKKVRSLTKYMFKVASVQGILTMLIIFALGPILPAMFTNDLVIRSHISSLIPNMAVHQILLSMTLVVEALAAGGKQFSLLAWGTLASTVASVRMIQGATSVEQIWFRGINTLFLGRCLTALIGVARVNGFLRWRKEKESTDDTV